MDWNCCLHLYYLIFVVLYFDFSCNERLFCICCFGLEVLWCFVFSYKVANLWEVIKTRKKKGKQVLNSVNSEFGQFGIEFEIGRKNSCQNFKKFQFQTFDLPISNLMHTPRFNCLNHEIGKSQHSTYWILLPSVGDFRIWYYYY